MCAAFKAKFPVDAVRGLKGYRDRTVDPEEWARQQTGSVRVGDIVLSFDPLYTAEKTVRGVTTVALYLVFRVEGDFPMCLKLTDDEYAIDSLETLFAQGAKAARADENDYLYAVAPCLSEIDQELVTQLHKFGSSGSRHAPTKGLPDPLVAFFAAVGAPITAGTPVSIGALAIALVTGTPSAGMPDLSVYYSLIGSMHAPKKKTTEQTVDSSSLNTLFSEEKKSLVAPAAESKRDDDKPKPEPLAKPEPVVKVDSTEESASASSLLDKFKASAESRLQEIATRASEPMKEEPSKPAQEEPVDPDSPKGKARALKEKIQALKKTRQEMAAKRGGPKTAEPPAALKAAEPVEAPEASVETTIAVESVAREALPAPKSATPAAEKKTDHVEKSSSSDDSNGKNDLSRVQPPRNDVSRYDAPENDPVKLDPPSRASEVPPAASSSSTNPASGTSSSPSSLSSSSSSQSSQSSSSGDAPKSPMGPTGEQPRVGFERSAAKDLSASYASRMDGGITDSLSKRKPEGLAGLTDLGSTDQTDIRMHIMDRTAEAKHSLASALSDTMDPGFELTTPGSEAIKSKLAKLAMSLDSLSEDEQMGEVRADRSLPSVIVNMLEQMQQAHERLEGRVTAMKADLVEKLIASKHALSEKEAASISSLERLREKCLQKISGIAFHGKSTLTQTTTNGAERIKIFQESSSKELTSIANRQRAELNRVISDTKEIVHQSVQKTDTELKTKVAAVEDELLEIVSQTEDSLNLVGLECAKKLDERINRFQIHGRLLSEGIVLSLESVCESAKLELYHSGQDSIKRIELLSKEALKSVEEQVTRVNKEFENQIDKSIRETLLPHLQSRRQGMLEFTGSLHEEFTMGLNLLLESKLAEFTPLVEACERMCAESLETFKAQWRETLDNHDRKLADIVSALNERVTASLAEADVLKESLKEFTKVTDYVLSNPDLVTKRDAACARFDVVGRENAARVQGVLGTRLQEEINQLKIDIKKNREEQCNALQTYGDNTVDSVTRALNAALDELEQLQRLHTGAKKGE